VTHTARSALFLPDVETRHQPGPYKALIDDARRRNAEYSKIWDLFAFQNDFTVHLARFTQGVIRTPASISVGLRELIAAYTSHLNACGFCTQAHGNTAAELLGDPDLVWSVLRDLEASPLEARDKALLRFVARMTVDLPGVGAADVDALRAHGWDDEAVYYAISTCALFNFYNRWISAIGVPEMSAEAHRQQGKSLAARGYGRD
jgi:uncharacterized peroxidase-related enzyme